MFRCVGLDHDLTRKLVSSGPACDLCEQLERLLGCPEIRQIQRRICSDDADKRNIREI
ncbi:hypothetical protein D3C80_1840640 [compost metagenome]